MKAGIRTSEFWVAIVAAILMEVNQQVSEFSLEPTETAVVWGPAIAYVISRGLAKMGGKN